MQLYGLTLQDGEALSSLINTLKSLYTQLVYIETSIDEDDKVAVLLKALPEAYGKIIMVLKKKPIPKSKDVINSLQEEDKKLGIGNKELAIQGEAYASTSTNRKPCHQ